MKLLNLIFCVLVFSLSSNIQGRVNNSDEMLDTTSLNDTINGVYIPKDMEDCFSELNKLLHPDDIDTFKKEEHPVGAYHFSLGMWLRNNWGLWGGSRLQKYFTKRGITHPDSMSGDILYYYHKWLNGDKDAAKKFEEKNKEGERVEREDGIWSLN